MECRGKVEVVLEEIWKDGNLLVVSSHPRAFNEMVLLLGASLRSLIQELYIA
jgi:hypothetical protein